MSTHLISFLGTGDYQPIIYHLPDGGEHESAHCPSAIASAHHCNETVLLGTEQARARHGEALQRELAALGLPLRIVDIPAGRNEAEMHAVFEVLRCEALAVPVDAELILDITHGFRSQPFFAGALVQYINALQPERTGRVRLFYGAYEARREGVAPVWDLTAYSELSALNAALRVFLDTGHGARLADLLETLGRRLARSWAADRQGPKPALDVLARRLRSLCAALDAVRIGALLLPASRDTPSMAARTLAAIDHVRSSGLERFPLLGEPLELLRQRLVPLAVDVDHLAGEPARPALSALARLYADWGRLPEAAIVLREAWTCLHAPEAAARPGESLDEAARRNADRDFTSARSDVASRIGDIRNDIEHGGFRKKPLPANAIRKRLNDAIEELDSVESTEAGHRHGTIWFVSRHPGAVEWAARQGLQVDRQVAHLDLNELQAGDIVIGTLPVNLAAQVCAKRARFFNLSLNLPHEARGRELSDDDLDAYGAHIEEYDLRPL